MTLATCTISPEVDAEGKAILPEVRYTSGAFRLVLLLLSLIGCLFKQLAAIRIHSPVEFSAVLEVSLSCLEIPNEYCFRWRGRRTKFTPVNIK